MRVAFIAAECEPFAKTGGLGDVVDALARALGRAEGAVDAHAADTAHAADAGVAAHAADAATHDSRPVPPTATIDRQVDVYLPHYRGMTIRAGAIRSTQRIVVPDPTVPAAVSDVGLTDVAADGYRLRLIDHPPAFDRENFYGDAAGDYADNAWRFGLFCRAALEAIRLDGGVDILHLHDWHSAPAQLLRDGPYRGDARLGPAATLLTIHNLAYHGWVPADRVWQLGLDRGPLGADSAGWPPGVRGADGVDLLRAGIERADLVNTVSPTFAAEALRLETGMGLDEVLRNRGDRFFGILNGIDSEVWNPASDPETAAPFDVSDMTGKAACRADLLTRIGFDPADTGAVFGGIGRLDPQKGFDLLAAAAPALVDLGARIVVQANGDPRIAEPLRRIAAEYPARVAFIERFDRAMARRIYAGADFFVMPSRFEPSGQGQMIALRYGTVPVVRRTGGLADSVADVTADGGSGWGFTFGPAEPSALVEACRRAIEMRGDGRSDAWQAIQRRGMALDFGWESGPAHRYLAAYRRALALVGAAVEPTASGASAARGAAAG